MSENAGRITLLNRLTNQSSFSLVSFFSPIIKFNMKTFKHSYNHQSKFKVKGIENIFEKIMMKIQVFWW